ncbi:MAG: uridine diphosphate-N-acetylglucosamine-binding protein YvcK [Erysipelothrix sp.]|nr:uridine diphosphate-N-acetylglucosamine-binding protein YvcK [Erysipelothrix sp.]
MTRVTVIGGGKGQSVILRGLKNIEGLDIKAIVSVSDDGGSTGRLRNEFNLPAMGDIRNVMLALSSSETLLSHIMNFRFDELDSETLGGHNLGNLILTALTKKTGSFMEAVGSVSKILKVEGEIIPASLQELTLLARMEDGTIVRGESNIPVFSNHIKEVFYDVEVKATEEAVNAIVNSDIIIFGVGSLYTSILPNIIIPEIRRALAFTKAKKVYYCNVMTQPGETDNYNGEDHVNAILKHMMSPIDYVIVDNNEFHSDILENYKEEDSRLVRFEEDVHPYRIMYDDLVSIQDGLIRHDHKKIQKNFEKLLEVI